MLSIKKNTWHYRIANFGMRYCKPDDLANDLCGYMGLVAGGLSRFVAVAFAFGVALVGTIMLAAVYISTGTFGLASDPHWMMVIASSC